FQFRQDPSPIRPTIDPLRRLCHRLESPLAPRPLGPALLPGASPLGPPLARQTLLRPDLVDQGTADTALVPRRRPRLIDRLVAGARVPPEVLGDERRLPLISAPSGRSLAPATLLDGGSSGRTGLRTGFLRRPLPDVASEPHLGPHLGHEGGADRALEPRRRPSLVHGPGVGLRIVVEDLLDEPRLAQIASRRRSRHERFSGRKWQDHNPIKAHDQADLHYRFKRP